MDGNRADANTRALVGLRIAVGVLFLIFAQYKVFGTQFTLGGGFQYWINGFLKEGAYQFMVPVLKGFSRMRPLSPFSRHTASWRSGSRWCSECWCARPAPAGLSTC
jgi:hypothetical protein